MNREFTSVPPGVPPNMSSKEYNEVKKYQYEIRDLKKELEKEKSKKKKIERSEKEERLMGDLNTALRKIDDQQIIINRLTNDIEKLKEKLD